MVAALGAAVTFAYGEEMMSFGLDTFQLPSLRVQTAGHRSAVIVALDKLCSYLKSAKKGENVSYAEVLEFLQSAQPTTIAAFLAAHPDAMCHCLLSKGSLAFVPGGWLLQEKAGNAALVALLGHDFILQFMSYQHLILWL